MDKKLYKFGMDWLNGVLPVSDVMSVFDMLEKFSCKLRFDRWGLVNSGLYNYSRRYWLDGKATIQLMYNPVSDEEYLTADMNHNNSGIFFSISGDGIRYLHSLGGDVSALNKLLYYFYRNSFKASRFDVYCDILDGENDIVPLIQEAFDYVGREQVGKPLIRTRLRRSGSSLRQNFKKIPMIDDEGNEFVNCQLGHHASTVGMFRCYNKLVEVSDGRLSDMSEDIFKSYDVADYWYRLEYEMHKDNASACFNALMSRAEDENTVLCFSDIFLSVFERVFTIGLPSTLAQLSTYVRDRIPSAEAWSLFGAELQANSIDLAQFKPHKYIKCTLSRVEKNSYRIKGYVYQIHEWLDTLSLEERRRFWRDAKESYYSNKRYNSFRDEVDEFHSAAENNRNNPLTWHQSDLTEFDMQLFA